MFGALACTFAVLVVGQNPSPQIQAESAPVKVLPSVNRPVEVVGTPSAKETRDGVGTNAGGPVIPVSRPAIGSVPVVNTPISVVHSQEAKIGKDDKNGKDDKDDKNGNGDKDEGPWRFIQKPVCGYTVTGFVYGTANVNPLNNGTRYNGPLTMSDQEGVFLNQLYLSIDRAMEDTFTLGGGVTLMYGNDYNASQSFGWELRPGRLIGPGTQNWNTGKDYGLALPQLFAEFGTKKLSLVLGHFWTPIGHCVVPANGNFFNTQPYSYMNGQPFDHWGGMVKYNPNDNWATYFGVVNGWGALDRQLDSAGLIFGAKYIADQSKWYNNFQMFIGQEPENLGANYGNRTLVNNVTYYKASECLELVHEFTLGVQENEGLGASTYYGFSPYLFRKINDNLKFGIRADIFRDPGGIVAGIRTGNPNTGPYNGTFYSVNAGLNWTPHGSKNLMVRPEIRYDWFDGNGRPYDAGNRKEMLMLMVGAYMLF